MADTPITGLLEVTSLADDDWITAVDISNTTNNATGENVKIQASNFLPAPAGEMTFIEKITIAEGAPGLFDFTGIPQTYDHLYLEGIVRSTEAGSSGQWTFLLFNGDATETNYYSQAAGGYNNAGNVTHAAQPRMLYATTAGEPANQWAQFNISVQYYSRTDIVKAAEGLSRARVDPPRVMAGQTSMFHDTMTAAITQLTLQDQGHPTTQLFGELTLYGVTRPT
jgi:hypothetical protein